MYKKDNYSKHRKYEILTNNVHSLRIIKDRKTRFMKAEIIEK